MDKCGLCLFDIPFGAEVCGHCGATRSLESVPMTDEEIINEKKEIRSKYEIGLLNKLWKLFYYAVGSGCFVWMVHELFYNKLPLILTIPAFVLGALYAMREIRKNRNMVEDEIKEIYPYRVLTRWHR
jgi:Flp pilus assembly protein TadB